MGTFSPTIAIETSSLLEFKNHTGNTVSKFWPQRTVELVKIRDFEDVGSVTPDPEKFDAVCCRACFG